MGKALVLYYSKDGHTAKMAEHVAAGCGSVDGIEVRRRDITDAAADDLLWCDGLALGAPTHLGSIPYPMKQWWDEKAIDAWQKIDGKFGCAFSSAGGWGGGAELTCQALMTVMMNFGMMVFGVTDYAARQFTLHYGATLAGEPRADREIEACHRLGTRLSEFIAYHVDKREDLHPCTTHDRYKRNPW